MIRLELSASASTALSGATTGNAGSGSRVTAPGTALFGLGIRLAEELLCLFRVPSRARVVGPVRTRHGAMTVTPI